MHLGLFTVGTAVKSEKNMDMLYKNMRWQMKRELRSCQSEVRRKNEGFWKPREKGVCIEELIY